MIIIRPREYKPQEKVYLFAVVKALGTTIRTFLTNMFGTFTRQRTVDTWEYPEEPRRYHKRARLVHRLTKRADGTPKCVACFLCATACPSLAIEMLAEESPDPKVEKRPVSFVIDELRCIYCGFCVEVCPKDAIRMDSDVGNLVGTSREDFVYTLEQLMDTKPRPGAYLGDKELEAKRKAGLG